MARGNGRRSRPPSPLPESFRSEPYPRPGATLRLVATDSSVPRAEPIRLSRLLALGADHSSPLRGLLDREPAEAVPEARILASRVLLPGVRRDAPIRARRDVLRSVLRPVFSARAERSLRICFARQRRRQVLFAKRRAGYPGSAAGPYRRTPNSNYSC